MSKLIPTYEEKISKPYLPLIDFEYLVNHPESLSELKEKLTDPVFLRKVESKAMFDPRYSKILKK